MDTAKVITPSRAVEKLFYPCSTGYVFVANRFEQRLQLPFYGMVLVSIDGTPIRITIDGRNYEYLAVAVWAKDVRFTVENARFIGVGVNPLHPLFRSFALLPAPHVVPLDREGYLQFHDLMCRAVDSQFTHTEALTLFNGVIERTRKVLPQTQRLDVRAQALMKCLWERPRSSLAELAQHLNLSYHRTSHLFTQTVGIPMRTYQLWQKLYKAGASLLKGASLTEVAHAAGFVDSAHYSKAFQTAYGRCPTEMFKVRQIIAFNLSAFRDTSLIDTTSAVDEQMPPARRKSRA
jgi:AraC-like DNA-binding protein